ncbi:MAG TPA: PAS domain S-box protein, partial [Thermoguttaceae bacterium]|nr:PAS domain S-box protein [Thermoguttaceae bacterium]
MKDRNEPANEQLIAELDELRGRVAKLESDLARSRQAEADHRHINDSLPVLVATAGVDGYYKEVNAAFQRILGWSREELLSRPLIEFIHPDDRARTAKEFKRLTSGETLTNFVDRKGCKDGSVRLFRWTVIPVLDRGIVFGIARDITDEEQAKEALQKAHDQLEQQVEQRTAELTAANRLLQAEVEHRRQIEDALRRSEQQYRTLVDTSPDAVVMTDLEGRVIFASPQAAKLHGYDRAEQLCGLDATSLIAEEDHQRLKANMANLLREGVRRDTQYAFERRDGSRIPCELSSAVVRDDSGSPRAFIAVSRDITERKQAQAALEHERRTLSHLLRASDRERQTIAYDIHDGLAQQLAGAIMQFQAFDNLKISDECQAKTAYDTGIELVKRAHAEARRLISGVRPPALDESGIAVAISHLVQEQRERLGVPIEYDDHVDFNRLAPILENAVYRITHEALANACQHSRSAKVRVSLLQENDLLH